MIRIGQRVEDQWARQSRQELVVSGGDKDESASNRQGLDREGPGYERRMAVEEAERWWRARQPPPCRRDRV